MKLQEKVTFLFHLLIKFGEIGCAMHLPHFKGVCFSDFDMTEKCIEVFMDYIFVFGHSFDACLHNLECVLETCQETNLVLNWKKCHFMVKEGMVLEHKISPRGIEVDKAKVEIIEKLPPPNYVKGVISFLRHARFCRHFNKDFFEIVKPLCNFLVKDAAFVIDEEFLHAFEARSVPSVEATPKAWKNFYNLGSAFFQHLPQKLKNIASRSS
ncbi:hypothetical protein L6164_023620 [Bauhinia variegata]|uniref:Uncharacterized protein n=1 Tax=Bauhinia variegata TaxID=167791 RepID=A0ACB9MKV1_BAUVA|nr:hypothetical protein L6164_023620 [Bauhinia variegata]